jgi:hypothetical protein
MSGNTRKFRKPELQFLYRPCDYFGERKFHVLEIMIEEDTVTWGTKVDMEYMSSMDSYSSVVHQIARIRYPVKVSEVKSGSVGERAGLQVGDVIEGIRAKPYLAWNNITPLNFGKLQFVQHSVHDLLCMGGAIRLRIRREWKAAQCTNCPAGCGEMVFIKIEGSITCHRCGLVHKEAGPRVDVADGFGNANCNWYSDPDLTERGKKQLLAHRTRCGTTGLKPQYDASLSYWAKQAQYDKEAVDKQRWTDIKDLVRSGVYDWCCRHGVPDNYSGKAMEIYDVVGQMGIADRLMKGELSEMKELHATFIGQLCVWKAMEKLQQAVICWEQLVKVLHLQMPTDAEYRCLQQEELLAQGYFLFHEKTRKRVFHKIRNIVEQQDLESYHPAEGFDGEVEDLIIRHCKKECLVDEIRGTSQHVVVEIWRQGGRNSILQEQFGADVPANDMACAILCLVCSYLFRSSHVDLRDLTMLSLKGNHNTVHKTYYDLYQLKDSLFSLDEQKKQSFPAVEHLFSQPYSFADPASFASL